MKLKPGCGVRRNCGTRWPVRRHPRQSPRPLHCGRRLLDGVVDISIGVNDISDAVTDISHAVTDISHAVADISDAVADISGEVPHISGGVLDTSDALPDISAAVIDISDALPPMSDGVADISAAVEEISDGVTNRYVVIVASPMLRPSEPPPSGGAVFNAQGDEGTGIDDWKVSLSTRFNGVRPPARRKPPVARSHPRPSCAASR